MSGRAATAVALASAAVALGLGITPDAAAARFAVGLSEGASGAGVAERLRARGAGRIVDLRPIRALTVSAPSAGAISGTSGVAYVERLRSRRESYLPNDPFLERQWYATQNRAFDHWIDPPPLASVRRPTSSCAGC